MNRRAWIAMLLCLCAPVVAARDDPDLQRLDAQLAQLEADPVLGALADGERIRAHQALADLAQAHSWQRQHLLYLAERRVATAQFAAEAELSLHRIDQLDREHDRILLAASRRDAERARAEAERLELQNQAREEAAQRAEADRQAQAQAAAGIAENESEQTQVLAAARAREVELAQQEAALRSGAPAPTAGSAIEHDPRGPSMALSGSAFASGRALLRPDSRKQLRSIVAFVQASSASKVRIEGHTDNHADARANLTLSQQRADAVRQALIAQGVVASRIQAVGLGAEQPIASNKTAAGRARNSRVEVILLRARQ
jgi:outer membrane protein OmpA-like peptidoglycan-associated protein